MGHIRFPSPAKLFCGLLLAPTLSPSEVEATLESHFGPISLRSAPLPFTQTTYYQREMGDQLTRYYLAFEPLCHVGELASIKHTSNRLEALWAVNNGQRQVNLDPGYLDLAKVVLATTKDYSHRLYIGGGIYAEVTLRYRNQGFEPWEWTYPDYCEPATLDFFRQLREMYKAQLRQLTLATRSG